MEQKYLVLKDLSKDSLVRTLILGVCLNIMVFVSCTTTTPKKEPTLVEVLIKNFQEHPKKWADMETNKVFGSCFGCQKRIAIITNDSSGIIMNIEGNEVRLIKPDTIYFGPVESELILRGYNDAVIKPQERLQYIQDSTAEALKRSVAKNKILNCK